MPLPTETKPEAIIETFFILLETAPELFSEHIQALYELVAKPTDSAEEIAKIVDKWCENRPQIYENMENDFMEMGAEDTDSNPRDEKAAIKFNERMKQNRERLGSTPLNSIKQNDSGTANQKS